jgi:hypothetical protein
LGPRDLRNLAHGDDILGNEHMGNAGQAEQGLGKRRACGSFRAVEKKWSAGMHGLACGEFARVGVAEQDFCTNR